MDDLNKTLDKFRAEIPDFENRFEKEYEEFRIGVMMKEARRKAGLTQEEVARRINTNKANVSRLENHAEDVKFSTIRKYFKAIGKKITINII